MKLQLLLELVDEIVGLRIHLIVVLAGGDLRLPRNGLPATLHNVLLAVAGRRLSAKLAMVVDERERGRGKWQIGSEERGRGKEYSVESLPLIMMRVHKSDQSNSS